MPVGACLVIPNKNLLHHDVVPLTLDYLVPMGTL